MTESDRAHYHLMRLTHLFRMQCVLLRVVFKSMDQNGDNGPSFSRFCPHEDANMPTHYFRSLSHIIPNSAFMFKSAEVFSIEEDCRFKILRCCALPAMPKILM